MAIYNNEDLIKCHEKVNPINILMLSQRMSSILERSDFNNYFIRKNCIEYFFYLLSY